MRSRAFVTVLTAIALIFAPLLSASAQSADPPAPPPAVSQPRLTPANALKTGARQNATAQSSPTPARQPPESPAGQTAPAPLKTNTRLIAVDVIATDSHGKVIRGLKADDFQITEERGGQQKISQFQFIDESGRPAPAYPPGLTAAPAGAPFMFTNLLPDRMRVPPTVMLMDALNTELQNQSEVHRHMVALLKTLPPATPIAIFVLGHQLHVLQSFTTDPALLRAALDHTLRAPDIAANPQDDADSPSNQFLDQNNETETTANQVLEDFEKMDYEAQMALRVDETTDAMVSIAKYLGGYPGRKNLLWFSASFPNWIAPNADFGQDSFMGSADYSDKIRKATEALSDARIAVYPVDARGLETSSVYSSASTPHINRNNPGASLAGTINRDSSTRIDTQATMQMIADSSGGKVCINTNDLSGCVQTALDDSSAYYELGYYPENVKWDGRFHKITVKTTEKGVKLRYRTGYVAIEPGASTKQTPVDLLKQACQDPLASTSIPMTAETLAPPRGSADPNGRFLLTISPAPLTFAPAGQTRQLNVQMAVCDFDPNGSSFQFFPRDLSASITDAQYQAWQTTGVRNIFDFQARPDDKKLRFVVLDVPSGALGSIDVPAHPKEYGIVPTVLAGSASSAASANAAPGSAPAPPTHVGFKGSNGSTSLLDWAGDAVSYHGELTVDQGARALYASLFGGRYHCEDKSLVPNDISAPGKPSLSLTLRKPDGRKAIIDLSGDSPAYSGDVPVDSAGRSFFDELWKLCHCQQP
jgi:VWFA-related protein